MKTYAPSLTQNLEQFVTSSCYSCRNGLSSEAATDRERLSCDTWRRSPITAAAGLRSEVNFTETDFAGLCTDV